MFCAEASTIMKYLYLVASLIALSGLSVSTFLLAKLIFYVHSISAIIFDPSKLVILKIKVGDRRSFFGVQFLIQF